MAQRELGGMGRALQGAQGGPVGAPYAPASTPPPAEEPHNPVCHDAQALTGLHARPYPCQGPRAPRGPPWAGPQGPFVGAYPRAPHT